MFSGEVCLSPAQWTAWGVDVDLIPLNDHEGFVFTQLALEGLPICEGFTRLIQRDPRR